MNLIVQPDDGAAPIVAAVDRAHKALDLVIFRFDLKRVEKAIEAAVERGVTVRALIAHTNSGGERRLRQLELRMLEAGVSVSRTNDDLVRYHGKMMIVDRTTLHVHGFNYCGSDLKCRSFGLVTRDRRSVQEALRLFEADALRQEYQPGQDALVVSPENAREVLAAFIKRARRQLLIWDPKVTDPQMIRLLGQRVRAGVDVRILGRVAKRGADLRAQKHPGRMHVRAIVRDGDTAFVGSQSLRALELDGRREIGLCCRAPEVVARMVALFEEEWAETELGARALEKAGESEEESARAAS